MRECSKCQQCFVDDVVVCSFDGQPTISSLPGEPVLDGRYQLEKRLGQGGMGIVYKAHHILLKSNHAIKVILPELVGNDDSVSTRFRQEAMAAAAIRHTNIISVTDYGMISGHLPFFVMEYVDGESLQDVMTREGRLPVDKVIEYMRVIGAGVGAAHQHGVLHRDLKPANIMIQRNRMLRDGLKILDFGLAKIKSGELLGSFVGAKTTGIIGSPYYMAPEQWSDEEPDKRCDIYSLGIILYQMLMGDVPFKGPSIPSVMKKHLMTEAPALANAREGISVALERVVHHALEKDPEARTPSAEQLLLELEAAVSQGIAPAKSATKRRTRTKPRTVKEAADSGAATQVKGEQKKVRRQSLRITDEQKKATSRTTRTGAEPAQMSGSGEDVARKTADQEAARQTVSQDAITIDPQDDEAWRRAADEARRRAEKRALLESGNQIQLAPAQSAAIPRPPRQPSNFIGVAVAGVALVLLVVFGAVAYILWPRGTPQPNEGQTAAPAAGASTNAQPAPTATPAATPAEAKKPEIIPATNSSNKPAAGRAGRSSARRGADSAAAERQRRAREALNGRP